jgi:NADPH:quinone reductase-like Zn-dependent oxidoreductase
MRAVVADVYGGPEVLRLEEVERPVAGAGDVLVRVRAAGVNAGDWHLIRGDPYLVRLGTGLRRPRQRVKGQDLAGVVEAVGAGVDGLAAGDEVFGWCQGAFAEHARTRATHLVAKPARASFAEAAATPGSGLTALQALRRGIDLRRGERLLVIGASGGVGTFAVQIAKALGAEVTGVCSGRNARLVSSLGADHVIDYTREDFARGDARYDAVLDLVGDRRLADCRRALARRGRLLLVGGRGGRWIGGTGRWIRALLWSPFVRQRLRPFVSVPSRADLETLAGMLAGGTLVPVVERTWTLAQTPDAIRHLEAGHVAGKLVIVP